MKLRLIGIFLFTLLLCNCGPKKLSEQEKAQVHLQNVENLFKANKLDAAKIQIDSINKFFPRQIDIRKKANAIFTQIQLIEQKKNLVYADSLLRIKKATMDSLTKDFVFEKDQKYEDVGNYVYKAQRMGSNIGRTYVKALVEETGSFLLTSIYCGTKPIKHFSVRFSVGSTFAETETVSEGSGYNYTYKDNGTVYENVVYKSDENKNIAGLIEQNIQKPIQVTFNGSNGKKTYMLSDGEKKAITKACKLSIVVSDVKNLEKNIAVAKKKIMLYEFEQAHNL